MPAPHHSRDRHLRKGRPKLKDVWDRYREVLDDEGRPNFLDIHDDIYQPGQAWNPSRYPRDCAGPANADKTCGRHNFCLWCHERRAHADAVRAAMVHIGQPNIHRIRIPLGQGRNHPKHARDCLRRVAGVLQRHNFTRQSIWLHPFEDNPCDGVRAHIEGIVSGDDADPDVLDPDRPGGLGLILRRFQEGGEDGALPVRVDVERLHPHSRKHVDDLVQHAVECATPSFPVKRIWAGLYMDKKKRVRCRMTTVAEGVRPTWIKDLPCKSPDHVPDATRDELLTWAVVAEHWRESVSKPVMTRNVRVHPAFVDLVARATLWRDGYRLQSTDDLQKRWQTSDEARSASTCAQLV